jgi:hypothetical protein
VNGALRAPRHRDPGAVDSWPESAPVPGRVWSCARLSLIAWIHWPALAPVSGPLSIRARVFEHAYFQSDGEGCRRRGEAPQNLTQTRPLRRTSLRRHHRLDERMTSRARSWRGGGAPEEDPPPPRHRQRSTSAQQPAATCPFGSIRSAEGYYYPSPPRFRNPVPDRTDRRPERRCNFPALRMSEESAALLTYWGAASWDGCGCLHSLRKRSFL